jgi:hypothetical protein
MRPGEVGIERRRRSIDEPLNLTGARHSRGSRSACCLTKVLRQAQSEKVKLGLGETVAHGERSSSGTGLDPKHSQHCRDVGLHCPPANRQERGDLGVRFARRYQRQHLPR